MGEEHRLIDITFEESAVGALKQAQHYGEEKHRVGSSVGVIFASDGKSDAAPTAEEIAEAQRRAEEAEQRRWAQAVPLGGSPADVLGFPAHLDLAPIAGGYASPERLAFQARLWAGTLQLQSEEEALKELQAKAETIRKNLARLLDAVRSGVPLRIWTSSRADDACGSCWLMAQLDAAGLQADVRVIRLPDFENRPDGTVARCRGWGEHDPGEFGRFLPLAQRVPPAFQTAMARHWRRLEQENALLRVVVSGMLVSAQAGFYDSFFQRVLDQMPETFSGATLLVQIITQYPRLPGDLLAWQWIQRQMEAGALQVLAPAPPDAPYRYACTLRKTGKR